VRVEAAFSRAELMTKYGAEYPLPNLLDHLAMPRCSKIKSQWDRCGLYYVNPIESERMLRSQRRRAPVEITSSRETCDIGVWSGIRLCLHPALASRKAVLGGAIPQ
jgi:hypothetical protein